MLGTQVKPRDKPRGPGLYYRVGLHINWTASDGLGNDDNALLFLHFICRPRSSRQLQHGRLLPFTEPGDQHDLPIWKFKGVMMFVRLVFVESPKTSHLLAELGLGLPVWV